MTDILKPLLYYVLMLSAFALMIFTIGCAFVPVFHNTAESELKTLSESLTNMRLEDLFRSYPTLLLVKSTDIGNGNMRHEFSYSTTETEDSSQRPVTASHYYLMERHDTYSINIFVNASGVIYEVLDPVKTDTKLMYTTEYPKPKTSAKKNLGDKTRSLPYPK